jgi:hypothetical protein
VSVNFQLLEWSGTRIDQRLRTGPTGSNALVLSMVFAIHKWLHCAFESRSYWGERTCSAGRQGRAIGNIETSKVFNLTRPAQQGRLQCVPNSVTSHVHCFYRSLPELWQNTYTYPNIDRILIAFAGLLPLDSVHVFLIPCTCTRCSLVIIP